MSENKQFTFDRDTVAPNIKTPIVFKEGERLSLGEVLDKLNELNDENEQSKMMIATLRNIVLENEDLEKENKELSEQVEYLKKQVKIFKGECNRLTKENTELLEELND